MAETYPGVRTLIRESLKLKDTPNSSIDILMSDLRDSSIKQYNTGLKLWWTFCKTNHRPVFDKCVNSVLSFLSEQFSNGASYGSLNTYRSAISYIIGPEVGQDLRIKKFFRGVSNLRPSKPKYNSTWDPSIVLEYLTILGPNEILSLEILTQKLVTLLALTTAHRVQTFALIDVRDIVTTPEGIEIKIPARIKTSGTNRNQPSLYLPFFFNNPHVCAARTLLCYQERTNSLRTDDNKLLFITYRRPYHKASSQSLSRWIKTMLCKSGLDTDVFTAHSTRHASTSAAARKDVSVDLIRKMAGWSNRSEVFARFYQRPLDNKRVFSEAVII